MERHFDFTGQDKSEMQKAFKLTGDMVYILRNIHESQKVSLAEIIETLHALLHEDIAA